MQCPRAARFRLKFQNPGSTDPIVLPSPENTFSRVPSVMKRVRNVSRYHVCPIRACSIQMSRHLSSHHVFVSVCVVQTTLSHVPMARSSNDGYTLTSPGTPLAGHDSMGASNSRSRGMRWCALCVTGGKRISITSLSPSSSTWAWMHTVHSSAPSHVCLMMLKSGETCLQSLTHARFLAFFSPFFKRNRNQKNRWTMTPNTPTTTTAATTTMKHPLPKCSTRVCKVVKQTQKDHFVVCGAVHWCRV